MTLGTPAIFRTLGTCPPPQPSMWKAWMVRPSRTRRVSSTERHSLRPSLCRATWTSCSSATRSAVSRARVWAPMSSWTLKPQAPPSASASTSGASPEEEPRPRKPMLTGQASKALKAWPQRPGGVDADAPDRPEFLADDGGHAGGERGLHDARRQQVDVGVDGARGGDHAFAGDDRGTGADDDVDAVEGVGVAGPPYGVDAALADADGHLADALDGVDDQHVADHDVAGLAERGGLEVQSVAGGLAESGEEFVAGLLGVGLDADDESGVAENDAVAGPRAVHRRVLVGIDAAGHACSSAPR